MAPPPTYATCPECKKVMLKKNFYSHLRVVHHKLSEEVLRIREELSREAGLAKVTCPLCKEVFTTHEGLAQHCQANHSEEGAGGRPQNYSIITTTFASREEYEVTCFVFAVSLTYKIYFNPEHSMDYIIDRLRKEDPTKSTKLSFVVKRDLRNIIQKYNMAPGWRHNDDLTSLQLRFEERNPDDGIRLVTLMVSDEKDRGLPGGSAQASLRPKVNSALQLLLKEVQLDEFERRFAEILVYLREKNQGLMATYLERNYLGTSFYYMVDT
ncbi:zinc finger, C2H2 type [Cooperia oncophora]